MIGETIEAIIASQSDIPVVTVRRGGDADRALAEHGRPSVLVFDAESDEDLAAVARRLADSDLVRVTAGCSGFAAFLPRLHDLPTSPIHPAVLRPPLLLVSGSLHERSLAQLRRAETRGVPSLQVDPYLAADSRWRRAALRKVAGLLSIHGAAIVCSGPGRRAPTRKAERMLRHLGKITADLARHASFRTIAIFGGDTASAVIDSLDVRGLEPVAEICQGVVVSRASSTLHVVTKAGGFGPVDVIERIVGALDKGA